MKKSVTRIFFLSKLSPILELFPFYKITLKSHICIVVTVMGKQCWSQAVLESGSWWHSVLQTPALVMGLLALGILVRLSRLVIQNNHDVAIKKTGVGLKKCCSRFPVGLSKKCSGFPVGLSKKYAD